MDDIEEKFNHYREKKPLIELGVNFEERVFAKIKRKKKQRQIAAVMTLGAVFIGVVMLAQLTLFRATPSPVEFAQTKPVPVIEKEEIPVVEDVVFASADDKSAYVIEQVSYKPEDNSL